MPGKKKKSQVYLFISFSSLHLNCVNVIYFLYPVSDISEPHEAYNGEVNSEDFWETLSMERIAAGLLKSKFITRGFFLKFFF